MIWWIVLELETLPAGKKPRSSHHRSPGGDMRRKGKLSTIFFQRTREGHHQSYEHWNCLKGNIAKTSDSRNGAHMGFPQRIDTILNWTKLIWWWGPREWSSGTGRPSFPQPRAYFCCCEGWSRVWLVLLLVPVPQDIATPVSVFSSLVFHLDGAVESRLRSA